MGERVGVKLGPEVLHSGKSLSGSYQRTRNKCSDTKTRFLTASQTGLTTFSSTQE